MKWGHSHLLRMGVLRVGTGNQVLGDHGQRIKLNTQRVYSRKRADLLSDSTLHRTREQDNSKQRLTSGTGGILFLQGRYFLASFGGVLLCLYK